MISNYKKTCLVLDLDDTLYKEYDYQTSGLKYVENVVSKLYNSNLNGKLLEMRAQGVNDIFLELTNILNLPAYTKNSFLMMYRYHKPKITLSLENKKFIKLALRNFGQLAILTDGRSISQRLKLEALGLLKIPAFISEEWNSEKKDKKRFIEIMNRYSSCSKFCYVGDNLLKDFLIPNILSWTTICLKGDERNIFIQEQNDLNNKQLPQFWVNSLSEINKC